MIRSKCEVQNSVSKIQIDQRPTAKNPFFTFCILLFILWISLPSCKKDDDNHNNPPPSANERITGGKMYTSDSLNFIWIYNYTGNLLTETLNYNAAGELTGRAVMQYTGDRLDSMTNYARRNSAMYRSQFIEFKNYSGGNPTEVLDHTFSPEGVETRQDKSTYVYEGASLKKKHTNFIPAGPGISAGA